MSILLETTFGDVVLDLDVDGSPALCKNVLKLAKARYYTNSLIYNVVPGRYCQMGDPKGDGTGGCSIFGLIDSYKNHSDDATTSSSRSPPDVTQSQRRFLQSQGRLLSPDELNQKGVVIAMEMGNVPHTIGSQFLITLSENNSLKDLTAGGGGGNGGAADDDNDGKAKHISLGTIAEDSQNILSKLNRAYCDDDGRPFADIRIQRALVIHDPFEDPPGMDDLLKRRGVVTTGDDVKLENDIKEGYPLAPQSPAYDRPPEEIVNVRIQADDTTIFATAGWDDNDAALREYEDEDEEDEAARQKRLELQEKQEEEWRQKQDTSRAVMLEMLGDRPTADVQAPENVLFVCKLNPLTNDEDLELIFARFDSDAKADIIRDPDSGVSLQYAFVEFTSNEACNEAYLKMNNALVDDRRIKVDFSQSVAHVWDRYNKKYRMGDRSGMDRGFVDGGRGNGRGRGRGGRGGGRGYRGGSNYSNQRSRDQSDYRAKGSRQQHQAAPMYDGQERKQTEFDSFGRMTRPRNTNGTNHNQHPKEGHERHRRRRSNSRSRSPSRDIVREERRRSRSDSRDRGGSRRSSSRSDDSSEDERRRKKHHKHRRRDTSSRRKRSHSDGRDRKRKKHHRHREREHSDKDERRRDRKHRRREREYSDEDTKRRDRKHRRHHRKGDDNHSRRSDERSRSRS